MNQVNQMSDIHRLLRYAVQALKAGQQERARMALARVLQLDPRNEWAWYYLSWTTETVQGSVQCLERALDINPRQPHVERRLRELRASTGSLTREERAVEVSQVSAPSGGDARSVDAPYPQIDALQAHADARDAELEEIRRDAEALWAQMGQAETIATRLQSETQSVIEAHLRMADELEDLRRGASDRAEHLGLVEHRLSETEVRVERAQRARDEVVARLEAVESRAEDHDVELAEIRREAEVVDRDVQGVKTAAASVRSRTQSVTEAHRELAGQLDGLRRAASHTMNQLNAVGRRLSEVEQAGDDVGRRVEALESRADQHEAELDKVAREVTATEDRFRSEARSIVRTQQSLADDLDDLHAEVLDTAEQLSLFQWRLSHLGAGMERSEAFAAELGSRVISLEGDLAPLPAALQSVDQTLHTLKARAARTEKDVAGLQKRVAWLQREYVGAPTQRPRWSTFPVLAVVLGLVLLAIGAVEIYPYVASRVQSGLLLGRAQAGAESPSEASAAPAATTPAPPGPSSEIDTTPMPGAGATVTTTLVATPSLWGGEPSQSPSSADGDRSPTAAAEPSTPTPAASPTATPLPTATPEPFNPTRLVVPKAGIDASVVIVSWQSASQTAGADGSWEVPDGGVVGWHDDSAPLGVGGNTVLNGHNTTGGEVFRDLYRVQVGDAITVYSEDVAFAYLVSEVLILPELGQPREVRENNASYLLPTDDERLTLVTCHPYGSLRNRLIVIARPL